MNQRDGWIACLVLLAGLASSPLVEAQEAYRLQETYPKGQQYHVSVRSDVSGTLTAPPEMGQQEPRTVAITGGSGVEYDERILDIDAKGNGSKTFRIYSRLDLELKEPMRTIQTHLRPEVSRMVILRNGSKEVPFSPDGPLTLDEIERVHFDVFAPALQTLFPDKAVKIGDSWPVGKLALEELTDMEEIIEGKLDCKLAEIVTRNNRRYAQVSFSGKVHGTDTNGPNQQIIEGYCLFDLQSNHLAYLYVQGTTIRLDKDGRAAGRLEGKYIMTRKLESNAALRDDRIRGMVLEPNDENSLILFDQPEFGVRFVHSRRWKVVRADGRQVILEEPAGGGIAVTLEPPSQTPTGQQFQAEVAAWLQKLKAKIARTTPARPLHGRPDVEHFQYETEMSNQNVLMDYFVVRQKAGGATFAGRFPLKEATALHQDAERMARSLQLIPPKK